MLKSKIADVSDKDVTKVIIALVLGIAVTIFAKNLLPGLFMFVLAVAL